MKIKQINKTRSIIFRCSEVEYIRFQSIKNRSLKIRNFLNGLYALESKHPGFIEVGSVRVKEA